VQLIQILLPLYDNAGRHQHADKFSEVRDELTHRFGGLTAFTRAPAEGLWKAGDREARKDDILLFEIMADTLDRDWWTAYRKKLEARFEQDEIVIRAQAIERL
jgi:hypothetical protein